MLEASMIGNNYQATHGLNSHVEWQRSASRSFCAVILRDQLDKTLHVDHQTAMSCVELWLRLEPLECFDANVQDQGLEKV